MKRVIAAVILLSSCVVIGASEGSAIADPGTTCFNSCVRIHDPGEEDPGCNYPGAQGNDYGNSCAADEWCYQKNSLLINGVCLKMPGAHSEQGCCSYHGGISGCRYDNHVICNDGAVSPSCMCR